MTRRAGRRPACALLAAVALLAGPSALPAPVAATPALPPPPQSGSTWVAHSRAAPTVGGAPTLGLPAVERPPVGAGALSIRITSVDPAIPQPGDELIVQGTVTNTSVAPVGAVSVQLRMSPTPLLNRDEIPEVLAGAGQRMGLPVAGAQDELAEQLAPGRTQEFELRTQVDDLGLATAGAYVTGAEVLGDSGAGMVRQDLDRTFLPWWPTDTAVEPVLLTALWPLTAPPLRDAEGVFLTEDAALEMSPAGRLSRMLDAGAADPGSLTLVVDPQAVQAAADMADGYQVRVPDGTVDPGTRSREVANWLERLSVALAAPGAQATGTLYAWPDVDAARSGKLLSTVLRQRTAIDGATQEILGRALPSSVVLPPGGVALPSTLSALAAAEVTAAVLSDQAAPPAQSTYFTPSGNVVLPTADGGLPALLLDSGLAQTLALPMGTPAEQTAVRQALMAQTLMTAVELPETQRLMVTGPDPTWDPPSGAAEMVASALTESPWLTPTSLAAALAREPSSLERVQVPPTPEQAAQQLPASHVTTVGRQYSDLRQYAAVITDPALVPEVTATAPTRLLGAWFREHPQARTELTDMVDDQVAGLMGSVRVVSSGSITVSGTSGTIPITVENVGPTAVTVGLQLSATPSQLFTADPVEPFTIAPARRTSVEVTAEVAASGPIPVVIRLVTAQGDTFGEPGLLVVESAAYANAARVLVQVALAALLLAVAVHGVRRARRRRGRPSAPQPPDLGPGAESRDPGTAGVRPDTPGASRG